MVKTALTPLGLDIEAIIISVVLFITGGVIIFACCFVITKSYLFYKRACLKDKRKAIEIKYIWKDFSSDELNVFFFSKENDLWTHFNDFSSSKIRFLA
uniref:Uncharacterized protein n=1 Tax=Onchocerca volvulus TaxID=6282 RepID=A0A8R1TSW2_ONCVO